MHSEVPSVQNTVPRDRIGGRSVTSEETQRMMDLCRLLQTEQNPARFSQLCQELSDLMEQKERRLAELEAKSLHTDSRREGSNHKD